MCSNIKIILAGGFLGAGKTTLLWKSSQYLMKRGKKTGLITNDQTPEPVESALLIINGLKVEEVSEIPASRTTESDLPFLFYQKK